MQCGLLFLMVNTFEMSSVTYANKHCEMTSFTPLPIAVLPGDPVALKEGLFGNFEGELQDIEELSKCLCLTS